MKREELQIQLLEKVRRCWDTYADSLLELSPSELISRANEIAASRYCHDQLKDCTDSCPEDLMEYLLRFSNPFKAMRNQWMAEQDMDCGETFKQALSSLRQYGPEPEDSPAVGGMTME